MTVLDKGSLTLHVMDICVMLCYSVVFSVSVYVCTCTCVYAWYSLCVP